MNACSHPLSFDAIVQYLVGELDDEDEDLFEQHLYACAACTRAVESVSALATAIGETIPPAVTTTHLEHLRRSLRIRETPVEVGQSAEAWFTPDVDLLIHALRANLEDTDRVDLEVYGAGEEPFMRVEAVPFDARSGVVYVACQRHLRGEQDIEDTRFRLVATRAGARRVLGDYAVRHHWGPFV